MIKTTFLPFRKFVFDPTPKRRISAPSGRGHLWPKSKRIRLTTVKMFQKFTEVSEKIGVKDFHLGAISPSTWGKLSKRKVLSYMGARARSSIMSIFEKSFPMRYVLCTFDEFINFRGVRGTKNRIVCVVFSLNVM